MEKPTSLASPEKNIKSETFTHRLWRWFIAPSMTIIYAMSRTRHVRVAGVLTAVYVSIAGFVAALAQPNGVLGGLLDYLIISIWLGSLFLNLSELALLIAANLVGLLVLLIAANLVGLLVFPSLSPSVTLNDILIGPFSFILVTSVLLIVMTRHRNSLEQDRRAELAEKEQSSRREAARTKALLRVADRLNTQLDLDALLMALSEEVAQAINTPASLVTLYDQKQNILYTKTGAGISPDLIKSILPLPKSTYDQTVKELGKVFALSDLQTLSNLPYVNELKKLNFRSIAFATMEYEHELIGSLNALSFGDRRDFTEDELFLLRGIAGQAALAIVNTRLYKDAHRRLENLQALRAIDIAIASNHDLRQTLEVLLDQITKQLMVDAVVILLLDETKQQLAYGAGRGFYTLTLRYTRLRIGEGIAGRAAQQRQIINIRDLSTDPQTLIRAASLAKEGFVSYYAAPLITKGQLKGVLEIFHRSFLDPDEEWLNFLEALAGQAAIAIENTTLLEDLLRSHDELSQAYDSTIEGWSPPWTCATKKQKDIPVASRT